MWIDKSIVGTGFSDIPLDVYNSISNMSQRMQGYVPLQSKVSPTLSTCGYVGADEAFFGGFTYRHKNIYIPDDEFEGKSKHIGRYTHSCTSSSLSGTWSLVASKYYKQMTDRTILECAAFDVNVMMCRAAQLFGIHNSCVADIVYYWWPIDVPLTTDMTLLIYMAQQSHIPHVNLSTIPMDLWTPLARVLGLYYSQKLSNMFYQDGLIDVSTLISFVKEYPKYPNHMGD